MNKRLITGQEVVILANQVAMQIALIAQTKTNLHIYGVPRGGIPVMYAVIAAYNGFISGASKGDWSRMRLSITDDPAIADIIVDDLVDSGKTMTRVMEHARPGARFFPLIHKGQQTGFPLGEWLEFPWEVSDSGGSIHDAFSRLIQFVGEDGTRPGLIDTPERMAKAWAEWTSGYKVDPQAILRLFEDGAEAYDEMVHVEGIPFYSNCEHHLAPFFGTIAFAYIPDAKIVGLSKMARLVEVFARRLQVQERLTAQIIDEFVKHVSPKGAGITIRARHLCMESRGINRIGCVTTTNRFCGVLKDDSRARMEYLALTNGH